jgi:hypothetical protein
LTKFLWGRATIFHELFLLKGNLLLPSIESVEIFIPLKEFQFHSFAFSPIWKFHFLLGVDRMVFVSCTATREAAMAGFAKSWRREWRHVCFRPQTGRRSLLRCTVPTCYTSNPEKRLSKSRETCAMEANR